MTAIRQYILNAMRVTYNLEILGDDIESLADYVAGTVRLGKTVYIAGNGGSASLAQHMAAELVGSFSDRSARALAAVALTTDTATITAIANDYGYDKVFSRQLDALMRPGDMLLLLSTSGNSQNAIEAAKVTHAIGNTCWALTGASGGKLRGLCRTICVPSEETSHVQEMHNIIVHAVCKELEALR